MKLFVLFNTTLAGVSVLLSLIWLGFNSEWPITMQKKQLDYALQLFFALVLFFWGVLVLVR